MKIVPVKWSMAVVKNKRRKIMKRFKISLKMTKRGCQMKVISKYRYYYRYFQTMEGGLSYAKHLAGCLKQAHPRCDTVSLFIDGIYQENLVEAI